MDNKVWEDVQKIYLEKFNIPPKILDLIACDEVMLLCVSGLSNQVISQHVEQDEEYIKSILKEFLGFEGWQFDLDINPFFQYTKYKQYDSFISNFAVLSPATEEFIAQKSFNLCRKFEKIRKEIEPYYASATT